MAKVKKGSIEGHSWVPFTLDHLIEKHGFKSYKTLSLLAIWTVLIVASMVSVYFMSSESWVHGDLNRSAINNYFMLYPPLIIGILLIFWLGFEWGFVPVFLATFVIAFSSQMPFYWAMLFAFAFILGLGVYAISYYCVPVDKSLRSLKSFAFFVVISLIAAIASSLGSFVWSFAHDMSIAQSMILWRGWWTGVLLQSVFIIAPLLYLFTPKVEQVKKRYFESPPANKVTLNWIYGAILTVSLILGVFIIGTNSLGTQVVDSLTAELAASVSGQFIQATDSFRVITWISITLVLGMGLGGVYLVGSWNRNLEKEVTLKTSELEKNRQLLEELLLEKGQILEGIHDRMRSNLTIMLSLIEVQLKNSERKKVEDVLKDSQSRLQTLAIVHEAMYQTGSVHSLNIKLYAIKLINRLNNSSESKNGEVEYIINSEDIFVNLDRSIFLAMILNELIVNVYQNAFNKSEKGLLWLHMYVVEKYGTLRIEISDKGDSVTENMNRYNKSSLGIKLSRLFVEKLGGTFEISDNGKNRFTIQIPLEEKEIKQNFLEREEVEEEAIASLSEAEL